MKFLYFFFGCFLLFSSCANDKLYYCWSCTTTTYAITSSDGNHVTQDTICGKTERDIKQYEKAHTNISKGFWAGIKVGTETVCEKYR